MNNLLRLWIISFTNPEKVFYLFRKKETSIRFTWWTTLFIYLVSYLALFSIFLGFNVLDLGAFVFILIFAIITSVTLIKNYFYTLILSYRKKELVSYQDVSLVTALSDTPLLLGLPILYLLSLWLGGGFIFIILMLFIWMLLRNRSRMFQHFYGVPTKFVYAISFGVWANVLILFMLFAVYLGVSLQMLMSYMAALT